MLVIRNDHKAIKVFTAGCIAFSVGLTGVAAYMNSALEHHNLVFNKEQTFHKPAPSTVQGTSNVMTRSQESSSTDPQVQPGVTTVPTPMSATPVAQEPEIQSIVTPGPHEPTNPAPADPVVPTEPPAELPPEEEPTDPGV